MMTTVHRWSGCEARALREAMRATVREFAEFLGVSARTVSKWEAGGNDIQPRPETQAILDTALERASDEVQARFELLIRRVARRPAPSAEPSAEPSADADLGAAADTSDDEFEALELARRVAASDLGAGTLDRLEQVVDDLAVAYPGTAPAELLGRVRRHLGYVMRLMDARKNLADHRRLLVVGSWLSLLAATTHIDLHQRPAAAARLRTALQMAHDVEHPELVAWCLETHAWQMLTDGYYQRAVALAQGAQRVAPPGTSVFIQAIAQEGRGWARLGRGAQTYDALARVEKLVAPLSSPDQPEHHYRYDPSKSQAYVATTLSWLGDPAAESHARQVLTRFESAHDGSARPRRAASARLDLSLALLALDRPEEAGSVALAAVTSGCLVPSNFWRAREVIAAVESRDAPEAAELRDAYETFCRPADPVA